MNSIYVEGELASLRHQEKLVKGEEERKAKESTSYQYREVEKGFNLKNLQLSLQRLGLL